MRHYPQALTTLIAYFKKFPGVGTKTAERFAFHLLEWPEEEIKKISHLLAEIKNKIKNCPSCHCLKETETCPFCDDQKRDSSQLCIIASAKEAFAFEETRVYRGLYHVIGGLLSPMDGRMPEHLHLEKIKERVDHLKVQEIIIALDSTLEGDTTALFLKEHLQQWGLKVSRLAFGLPMGSSLDFVDGGTLTHALTARQLL